MRFLTAGESHGKKVTAIVEGFPSNVPINKERMTKELFMRQGGYGRGRRMQIEKDTFEFGSGVRHGYTLGSPVQMEVNNDDFKQWVNVMQSEPITDEQIKKMRRVIKEPRPGHADLVGGMKYNHRDLRNVLERSSARETTARVLVGALCKELLHALNIEMTSRVVQIGTVIDDGTYTFDEIKNNKESSSVRMVSDDKTKEAELLIDQTKAAGDTLGGVVEVIVKNPIVGLGSHVHYDTKLDGKIAQSIVSINAFKGVEFGMGFKMADYPGSQVHDEILYNPNDGFTRRTNNLGGFEGGMTTGMPVVVRGVMKPIPTLYKPLMSVNIDTKEPFKATIERSDPTAVPAASIVAEHMVAIEITKAILDKFGSDDFSDIQENIKKYNQRLEEY